MKHSKKHILDDFSDFSPEQKEKILWDFDKAHRALKPRSDYREWLFSRLETLYYFWQKKHTLYLYRLTSAFLVFTLSISWIWYFYSQTYTERWVENIYVSSEKHISEEVFLEPMGIDSQEPSWPVMDLAMSRMLEDMQYSEEEKHIFQEVCLESRGFFVEEEDICILDMSEICWLDALRMRQQNTCSIFYREMWDEISYEEMLPYQGQ